MLFLNLYLFFRGKRVAKQKRSEAALYHNAVSGAQKA